MLQSTQKPLISICAPCFNHQKYIPYFMETLLKQEFQNWELIITDDCSTDDSWSVLQQYTYDSRIKIFKNDTNRHLCQTMNNSFLHAKGKYICIMYTDDAFVEGKLKHDFEFLEKNTDISVLYNDLIAIGENNEILQEKWSLPKDFSKWNLLRKLFLVGNCLFIPGMFLRKSCLDEIGMHNPFLCLTQDYEFHIRMLLNFEIAKSESPFVYYRRRDNEQNLSANTLENINFIFNEMGLMLPKCLNSIPNEVVLKNVFPELNEQHPFFFQDRDFYIGKIMLNSKNQAIKNVGLQILYSFCLNHIEYLEKTYNFLPKDFMSYTKVAKIYKNYSIKEQNIHSFKEKFMYRLWHKLDKKLRKKGIIAE